MPYKFVGQEEREPGQVYLVYADSEDPMKLRYIPRELVSGGRGAAAKIVADKPGYMDEGEKNATSYYEQFPGRARYAGTGSQKHFETGAADGQQHSFVGTDLAGMRQAGYATTYGPTSEEIGESVSDNEAIERAMRAVNSDYNMAHRDQAQLVDRDLAEDSRARYRPNDPPLDTRHARFRRYNENAIERLQSLRDAETDSLAAMVDHRREDAVNKPPLDTRHVQWRRYDENAYDPFVGEQGMPREPPMDRDPSLKRADESFRQRITAASGDPPMDRDPAFSRADANYRQPVGPKTSFVDDVLSRLKKR